MALILSTIMPKWDVLIYALVALASLPLFWLITFLRNTRIPKGLRLPPGPPGRFISGNAADIPTHHEWETFNRWAKEYGGLVHIKVFTQSMIFVNSADIAHELFEKRSSIYSDRFDFPMLNDLMGWEFAFILMRYGDEWRKHRKMFHQNFNPQATVAYHGIQTDLTREFLGRLNESPDEFVGHIRHLAGAIIMQITYGIKVLPKDDPYIKMAEKAVGAVAKAGNPGTYLVDALPLLKYVPEWFPGAGFRRMAREWREPTVAMTIAPFIKVKDDLAAGTAGPSVAATLLEEQSDPSDEEETKTIRNVSAIAYAAGADTIVGVMTVFILAMVLHPEAQRKAQAELDTVIGERLPEFDDMENLPYINALCKEVHRWHPILPMGVSHRVMQDDVFGDYFIPGGSVVTGNAWGILHDEKLYGPRTENFEPERFLQPDVVDPIVQYGFGRRICAGRFMADESMFIGVASILKVFSITLAKDDKGREIPVTARFKSGLISHPEPFRCSIKPRSESAESLITAVV